MPPTFKFNHFPVPDIRQMEDVIRVFEIELFSTWLNNACKTRR